MKFQVSDEQVMELFNFNEYEFLNILSLFEINFDYPFALFAYFSLKFLNSNQQKIRHNFNEYKNFNILSLEIHPCVFVTGLD